METETANQAEIAPADTAPRESPPGEVPEHGYRVSAGLALRIALRGIQNLLTRRPILLPFEVTRSCNCNCRHCQLGGVIANEVQATPEEFARWVRELKPAASQISGGEPFLRPDLMDIVRAIKQPDGLPYLIFVTNAAMLNEERYLALKDAGVNQFSVSLDFPDERHDTFRGRKGLFAHLSRLLPALSGTYGFGDIVMNTAIHRENLPHLMEIIDLARSWGVCVSFSAYTVLRTGEENLDIKRPEDLALLSRTIEEIIAAKADGAPVMTPASVLRKTHRYFEVGMKPDCAAGRRFACVMPNGDLVPCAYFPDAAFASQREMLRDFTSRNDCGKCFVSVRAYTDQSVLDLLLGSLSAYLTRRKASS